jgi:hypothetical protein
MNPPLVLVLAALPAGAQVFQSTAPVQPVPDGAGGLASVLNVATAATPLAALRVRLDVGGADGFLGDLFVTLQHEGGAYTVLLNRPGRDAGTPDGYADRGLDVTFDLAAPDIHVYRDALGGPPSGGRLTGTWSPDGRTTDPADVLAGDPRATGLGAFTGLNPNGEWTLFLADVNPGGQVFLNAWALELVPVPEPRTAALMALALGAAAMFRRRPPAG